MLVAHPPLALKQLKELERVLVELKGTFPIKWLGT